MMNAATETERTCLFVSNMFYEFSGSWMVDLRLPPCRQSKSQPSLAWRRMAWSGTKVVSDSLLILCFFIYVDKFSLLLYTTWSHHWMVVTCHNSSKKSNKFDKVLTS